MTRRGLRALLPIAIQALFFYAINTFRFTAPANCSNPVPVSKIPEGSGVIDDRARYPRKAH